MTDTPTCERIDCDQPLSDRRVTLIRSSGEDGATSQMCDPHTDDLLQRLIPTYEPDGRPAYRIIRGAP